MCVIFKFLLFRLVFCNLTLATFSLIWQAANKDQQAFSQGNQLTNVEFVRPSVVMGEIPRDCPTYGVRI